MIHGMLLTVLGLGFALGLRHALEPDHVVAVSTIVGECKSVRKSSLVGTFWGLGHMASLLFVSVVVLILRLSIPERVALWMEFAVAVMLVALGVNAVRRSMRGWKMHIHMHTHDGQRHIHVHLHRPGDEHTHYHRHLLGFRTRPFFIGMVHGMAGSAALMILVLATIPSVIGALVYIGVFGLGSIGGMLIMSSLMSLPFALTRKRFGMLSEALQLMVGLSGFAFGLFLLWQYGFQEHLIH